MCDWQHQGVCARWWTLRCVNGELATRQVSTCILPIAATNAGGRTARHEDEYVLPPPLPPSSLPVHTGWANRELATCAETPLRFAILEKFEEASVVEIAGLESDTPLNDVREVCPRRGETNADQATVVLRDGRRVNARARRASRSKIRSAVALLGPEDGSIKATVESHNLTHTHFTPWCEMCVQARGTSDWRRTVSDVAKSPVVQFNSQFIFSTGTFRDELTLPKATILIMVDKEIG